LTSLKKGKLVNDDDSIVKRIETTEQIIKDAIRPLIDEVKSIGWSVDTDPSDAEVLGVIVSKFVKWDAGRIMEVAHSAFEDANFDARIELDD